MNVTVTLFSITIIEKNFILNITVKIRILISYAVSMHKFDCINSLKKVLGTFQTHLMVMMIPPTLVVAQNYG